MKKKQVLTWVAIIIGAVLVVWGAMWLLRGDAEEPEIVDEPTSLVTEE